MDEPLVWYWLIHHGILVEPLTEPLENRISYIKEHKPEREHATRLAWMRPVKDVSRLPLAVIATGEAYHKAVDAYSKAVDARDKAVDAHHKARDARNKALVAHDKALDAYTKARDAYDKTLDAYSKAQDAYDKAWDAYDKAWDAYSKAWDAYTKARDAHIKAITDNMTTLKSLHQEEYPGSPFDYERRTLIFSLEQGALMCDI